MFRTHFLILLEIMALPPLFLMLVSLFMVFVLVPSTLSGSHVDPLQVWAQMSPWRKASVLMLFLATYGVLVRAWAATVFAASEFHLGHSIRPLQAYSRIRRRHLRLFWLLFLMNLLGGAGGPLVIATVAANVFFVPAIPIALLENLNVFQAVKRSVMLTKQGYGRIFLLFLL